MQQQAAANANISCESLTPQVQQQQQQSSRVRGSSFSSSQSAYLSSGHQVINIKVKI